MPGQTAYNSAKFAVRGFTEALRQELLLAKRPVQVTCVHPGGIKTAIARNARATASHDQAHVAQHFDTKLARMTPSGRPRSSSTASSPTGRGWWWAPTPSSLDLFVRLVGARYQRVFTPGRSPAGPLGAPGPDRNTAAAAAAPNTFGLPVGRTPAGVPPAQRHAELVPLLDHRRRPVEDAVRRLGGPGATSPPARG